MTRRSVSPFQGWQLCSLGANPGLRPGLSYFALSGRLRAKSHRDRRPFGSLETCPSATSRVSPWAGAQSSPDRRTAGTSARTPSASVPLFFPQCTEGFDSHAPRQVAKERTTRTHSPDCRCIKQPEWNVFTCTHERMFPCRCQANPRFYGEMFRTGSPFAVVLCNGAFRPASHEPSRPRSRCSLRFCVGVGIGEPTAQGPEPLAGLPAKYGAHHGMQQPPEPGGARGERVFVLDGRGAVV